MRSADSGPGRIDIDGVFWEPSSPESYVAGRLIFDEVDGAKLDLIGRLSASDGLPSSDSVPQIIHGVAGTTKYTLRDCLPISFNVSMPGIEREAYRISDVFKGVHLDNDCDSEFVSVRIEIRHLAMWVERTGISAGRVGDSFDDYRIAYVRPASESAQIGDGTLEVCHGWKSNGDHFLSAGVEHSTFIKLAFDVPQDLEDICSTVIALQDLVTLGMDSTAVTTEVTLEHAQHTRQLLGGSIVHDQIELIRPWLGTDVPGTSTRIRPDDVLFTFDNFGRASGVANWLDVRTKFRLTINALLSHRYMPKMYGENRLQNAVFAAESFDRARFKNRVEARGTFRARRKRILQACPQDRDWLDNLLQYANEPRLVARLIRLAEYAGARFQYLVEDVEAWAQHVKNVRNELGPSRGK